jgi:acyl-CoA dehydrogenase
MREMLEQSIEKLFAGAVRPELLAGVEDEGRWAAALWREAEGAGFTMALVSEEAGGAGAGWADAAVLFKAAGKYAAPIPFCESVLAAWLLSRAGVPIPEGPMTIAEAEFSISEGRARGRLKAAPWGRHAEHVVVVHAAPDPMVMLFGRAGLEIVKGLNMGGEPVDDMLLDGVEPLAVSPLPSELPADSLRRAGALIRAAQMTGGLQRLCDLSLRYAEERSQFGRLIGKFQAVQQQLAVLAEHAALASIAADAAFGRAEEGFPEMPTAAAKIIAGEAATAGCAIAHAVHGAIGVTHEHALHLATRRLWAWRDEFGSETYWSDRLGRSVAAREACEYWSRICA